MAKWRTLIDRRMNAWWGPGLGRIALVSLGIRIIFALLGTLFW